MPRRKFTAAEIKARKAAISKKRYDALSPAVKARADKVLKARKARKAKKKAQPTTPLKKRATLADAKKRMAKKKTGRKKKR